MLANISDNFLSHSQYINIGKASIIKTIGNGRKSTNLFIYEFSLNEFPFSSHTYKFPKIPLKFNI